MAHNTHLAVTEQRWQQICSNEAAADGQFFLRHYHHPHILPALLPLSHTAERKCGFVWRHKSGIGRGLPPLQTLQANRQPSARGRVDPANTGLPAAKLPATPYIKYYSRRLPRQPLPPAPYIYPVHRVHPRAVLNKCADTKRRAYAANHRV